MPQKCEGFGLNGCVSKESNKSYSANEEKF